MLKQTVKVLEHLDVTTRLLSADQNPTHLIAVHISLMNNLPVCVDDDEAIESLKLKLMQLQDKHYIINDLHYITAVLDQRLKNTDTIMPPDCKQHALTSIRSMMSEVPAAFEEETKASTTGAFPDTVMQGYSNGGPRSTIRTAKTLLADRDWLL